MRFTNASASIQRLRAARADEWMRIYLDERIGNEANVGFFLRSLLTTS